MNIILNIIFIPKYGALAAVLTTFAGYFIMMLITYFLSKKVYNCNYHIIRLIVSVLVCFVLCIICNVVKLWIAFMLFVAMALLIVYMYKDIIKFTFMKLKNRFSRC